MIDLEATFEKLEHETQEVSCTFTNWLRMPYRTIFCGVEIIYMCCSVLNSGQPKR
jgi:hypothetical protein